MAQQLNVVDVFCGAGGLSCGFAQAGFIISFGVDRDSHAARTFQRNHVDAGFFEGDIREFRIGSIGGWDMNPESSVLVGGPPCQGFSESNRRTRSLGNPENHLFLEYMRLLEEFRPAWFVVENVAGLLTVEKGWALGQIIERASSVGYKVTWRVLDAADFGVPQHRRRLFVIGNRIGRNFEFPTAYPGERVTVWDALSDLPELENGAGVDVLPYGLATPRTPYQVAMRKGSNGTVQGNLVTRNCDLVIERYRHIPPGKNWAAIPVGLMQNYRDRQRCHTGIYWRLDPHRPSKVIGNFRKNMLVHPFQDRGLSVREAARLQSFPDTYEFLGSVGFQQQQVADAVPPLLARVVATTIARCHDYR